MDINLIQNSPYIILGSLCELTDYKPPLQKSTQKHSFCSKLEYLRLSSSPQKISFNSHSIALESIESGIFKLHHPAAHNFHLKYDKLQTLLPVFLCKLKN